MKLIIAGSRNLNPSPAQIGAWLIGTDWNVTELVSGGAHGVDQAGEEWASVNKVPIKRFIPDWGMGKQAGILRNADMVKYADCALFVWDGVSRGTKSTIDFARKKNIPLKVVRVS